MSARFGPTNPVHPSRVAALIVICVTLIFSQRVLFADADLSARISALDHEIVQSPENGELYLRRANLHRLQREWKDAEADYARAELLHASFQALQLGRGLLKLESGHAAEAIPYLEELLALHPDEELGRSALARSYAASGRSDDALRIYGLLQRDTPTVDSYFEPAQMLVERGRAADAIVMLDAGIARLGLLPVLDDLAADLETRSGFFDRALLRIDRRLEHASRKEFLLVRRAEVLRAGGRVIEMESALTSAEEHIRQLPSARREAAAVKDLRATIQSLRSKH